MIRSAPYYWVVCDGCETNAQAESDYSAFGEADGALCEAEEAGWTFGDGKHWCDGCTMTRAAAEESTAGASPVPSGEKTP